MKIKYLPLILVCFSVFRLSAGEQKPDRGIFISGLQISFATQNGTSERLSRKDLELMAPGSVLLDKAYQGMNVHGMYLDKRMPQIGLGFELKQKNSGGPAIRFGLLYGSGPRIRASYYRHNSVTIDTLISIKTGRKSYIDSVSYEDYRLLTSSGILQLDISAVWRTGNNNKFTLFGGFGCNAGFSVFANTVISHSNYSYYNGYNSSIGRTNSRNEYENERFKNKIQSICSVYIPLGLDYRFSKKSEFWKNMHIFYEARFRLQYYSIPERGNAFSGNYFSSIGLRYSMPDDPKK